MKPILYIFTKAPVLGRVKTRLAVDIGHVHALRLYKAMIARVLRHVRDPRWDVMLAVTPPESLNQVKDWDGFAQVAQVSGSLSPRLAQIFSRKGPVVVIGTDCPQVRARDIADALKALRHHHAVFGPAVDGGFWLMAMTGPVDPKVFEGVRWSSADTLSDIEANIDGSIARLRTLVDVDDLPALRLIQTQSRHLSERR